MAAIKSRETLKAEHFSWNHQVSDVAAVVHNTDTKKRKESFPEAWKLPKGYILPDVQIH